MQHLNTSTGVLSSNLGVLAPASSGNGTQRTTIGDQFIVQACSYLYVTLGCSCFCCLAIIMHAVLMLVLYGEGSSHAPTSDQFASQVSNYRLPLNCDVVLE